MFYYAPKIHSLDARLCFTKRICFPQFSYCAMQYFLLPISHSLQSHAKPHTFAENHQNHRLLYNDFGESDRNKLMISEVKITDTANDKDNQTRMRKPVTRRRRRHRLRKPKKSQDKWTALVGKLFFLSIHFTV